jgi:hypothetical protein
MRISRVLTAKTASISGIEVDLFTTRRYHEAHDYICNSPQYNTLFTSVRLATLVPNWILIQFRRQRAAHVCPGPRGDAEWSSVLRASISENCYFFRKCVTLSTDRLHSNWNNYLIIALTQIWLAGTYKVPFNTFKTFILGCVAFELLVRKLMAAQNCQGGDELAPWSLKFSTETSHCQRKTKQYDIIIVTIMA